MAPCDPANAGSQGVLVSIGPQGFVAKVKEVLLRGD
jgi:hypothetical protein